MSKKIEIYNPIIETVRDQIRITYRVILNDSGILRVRNIWYLTDSQNKKNISRLANGVVVGLIPLALKEKYDMEVHAPVDSTLIHNLNQFVIPMLCQNDSRFFNSKINAELFDVDEGGNDVGTGLSLGVDSFSTIHDYAVGRNDDFKLTNLAVFTMYGRLDKNTRVLTSQVASELNLPVSYYESNVCTAMDDNLHYISWNPFYMASIILTLGTNYKRYLFSGDASFSKMNIKNVYDGGVAHASAILLPYLGTDTVHFYCSGDKYTRAEKTKMVAFDPIASKYVTPCLHNFKRNCGWCFKCKRTLVTADVGGYLDRLSNAFDIENYIANRKAYLLYLYENKNSVYLEGVYETLKRNEPELCDCIEKEYTLYRDKYRNSPDWFASVAAETGNVDAKMRLATLYYEGKGGYGIGLDDRRPINYPLATKLAKDCYLQSDDNLLFYIKCLSKGSQEDKQTAFELCKVEAEKKSIFAKQLSEMYHKGIGTKVNDSKAYRYGLSACINEEDTIELIKLLSDTHSRDISKKLMELVSNLSDSTPESVVAHARYVYHHSAKKTAYSEAKSILEPFIDYGIVADLYTNMMINQRDYGGLRSLCENYAFAGSPIFQYKLALCYMNGWDCEPNNDEVIYWLSILVISKDESWHTVLLSKKLLERGTKNDLATAFDVTLKRTKRKPDDAANWGMLARMYRDGRGTSKSLDKAVECFYKARFIDSNWINELADALITRNTEFDLSQALNMSIKKALKGDIWCQLRLCRMYKQGIYVRSNIDQAILWAKIAASSGNDLAIKEYEKIKGLSTGMPSYDIGLVSFWFANNYGAILTAFALYHHLEDEGYKVLMIEKPAQWWPAFDEKKDPLARLFGRQYFNLSRMYTPETLPELNDYCDTFIVGSDQMWNYCMYETAGNYTFLDFTKDDKKRIAYSTSFGHNMVFNKDPAIIEETSLLMKRFDAISTREETGVSICREIFGVDSVCNLDSVFLCEKSVYDSLAEDHLAANKPQHYIFAYILDGDFEIEQIINKVSTILNLEVIVVIDGGDVVEKKKIEMSHPFTEISNVGEWLDYLRSADYVITDSFHGSCFSIIFNKNFISIRNELRGGTRFDSILGKVDLLDRMINKSSNSDEKLMELCNSKIDYEAVNAKLKKNVEASKKWLKHNLNSKK